MTVTALQEIIIDDRSVPSPALSALSPGLWSRMPQISQAPQDYVEIELCTRLRL
jgi:hypothetical protein